MIERLPNLPDQVVGVVASGKVDASDYETVIVPAVELALKAHGRVRFLYQLAPSFSGFTPGAAWNDLKVGISHLRSWEKIAVVTDLGWVAGTARMFRFIVPCPVRVFANKDFAEAARWIAAA